MTTAIVTAENCKNDVIDEIQSLDSDIVIESKIPFSSIVISMRKPDTVEDVENLSSVRSVDIEGKGSIKEF